MPVETAELPIVSDVDRRLGRIPEFDDKSLNFPMRELTATKKRVFSKAWKIRQRINQKNTPRCVGYGCTMEVGMQPHYHNITEFLADIWYQESQKIDYWKHMPHDGTSTLAGLETGRKLGFYPEYRWALKPSPMQDVLLAIANIGPVVAGFSFYEGMYKPDASGVVSVTGKNVGGHFMTFNELDWQKKRIYTANTWGDAGLWLSLNDFEKLIYDNGEVAIIVKRD